MSVDSPTVMDLSAEYGALDGVIIYTYATRFAQVATSLSTTQPTRLTALADSLGYVPATGASCTPRRWRCRRSRAKGRFGDLSPASGNGRRHREGKVDPRTLKSWETTRSPGRSIEPPIPPIPPAALQLGTHHLRCGLFEVFTPGCSNPNAMTRIGFPYGEHHKGKVFVGPHQQRATVWRRSALFGSSVAGVVSGEVGNGIRLCRTGASVTSSGELRRRKGSDHLRSIVGDGPCCALFHNQRNIALTDPKLPVSVATAQSLTKSNV
jgi:hypothetical protein